MNERQNPRLLLRITILVVFFGIMGLLLWLSIVPPDAVAPYQPWFQAALNHFGSIILTACGIVLTAWGLFYHSWFAARMGARNSSMLLRFGPTGVRIVSIVFGLLFLIIGIVGVLHH